MIPLEAIIAAAAILNACLLPRPPSDTPGFTFRPPCGDLSLAVTWASLRRVASPLRECPSSGSRCLAAGRHRLISAAAGLSMRRPAGEVKAAWVQPGAESWPFVLCRRLRRAARAPRPATITITYVQLSWAEIVTDAAAETVRDTRRSDHPRHQLGEIQCGRLFLPGVEIFIVIPSCRESIRSRSPYLPALPLSASADIPHVPSRRRPAGGLWSPWLVA